MSSRGQRILTVGDGDFSFSLALARALGGQNVVATSYESYASLQQIYGTQCTDVLRELALLGARVAHGVDAADLPATLPLDCSGSGRFERIVWNVSRRHSCARVLPRRASSRI
jgi:25S rRNA (uracil2634-N3)-methyltransferase